MRNTTILALAFGALIGTANALDHSPKDTYKLLDSKGDHKLDVELIAGMSAKTGSRALAEAGNPAGVLDRVSARRSGTADVLLPGKSAVRLMEFQSWAEASTRGYSSPYASGPPMYPLAGGLLKLRGSVVDTGASLDLIGTVHVYQSFEEKFEAREGLLRVRLFGQASAVASGRMQSAAQTWKFSYMASLCQPLKATVDGNFDITVNVEVDAEADIVVYRTPWGDMNKPKIVEMLGKAQAEELCKTVASYTTSAKTWVFDGESEDYDVTVMMPRRVGSFTVYYPMTITVREEIGHAVLCDASFRTSLCAQADHFTASVSPDDRNAKISGDVRLVLKPLDNEPMVLVLGRDKTLRDDVGGWAAWIDLGAFLVENLGGIPLVTNLKDKILETTSGYKIFCSEVLSSLASAQEESIVQLSGTVGRYVLSGPVYFR